MSRENSSYRNSKHDFFLEWPVSTIAYALWAHFEHYGKPFWSGKFSLVHSFIEIMETICEKAFKKAFKSNGC